MKRTVFKTIFSLMVTLCMLISVFTPCMGVLAENLNTSISTMNFPSPVFSEDPQYSYETAKPNGAVNLSFSEKFNPDLAAESDADAPVISGVTAMAGPNDSVTVQGEGFEGGTVWVYGLSKEGNGMFLPCETTLFTDVTVNAIISEKYQYSMYMVWVESASGVLSRPAFVNKAESDWMSENIVSPGASLCFYGKNLTTDNADGDNCVSYIYLTNGGKSYKAEITDANPYRVTFTVPEGIADGEYKVWAHNGHGGDYGWSKPLTLTVEKGAENLWTGKTHTVSNVTQLLAAIDLASNRDTILLENGVYQLDTVIEIRKELRFVGESKGGVKFICSPPDYSVKNCCTFKIMRYPSEFRNISFEDDVNDFATHGIKNATCMFIYAWGYEALQKGNKPEELYLRVEDCEFKVNRLYDGIEHDSDRDPAIAQMLREKYTKDGVCYYSESSMHHAPLYIDMLEAVYVNNCHFIDGYGASIHYCNKVIFTNNTSAGNWIMYGSSASALVAFFSCNIVDVSNNKIHGMDYLNGIEYELYGLGFDRAIVFQMPSDYLDNCYIADNEFRGCGEEESNAGETILFESRDKIYAGAIDEISANGQVITFHKQLWVAGNDENKNNKVDASEYYHPSIFTPGGNPYTRWVLGSCVWVMNGKGQSQYRKVVDVTADSLILDRPFDIVPAVKGEENESFIMVVPAMTNVVVFRNSLVGLKYYGRTSNASAGIQGYATMFDYVVDRNYFSRVHTGIYCDMAFDVRYAELDGGPSGFADTIVLNNVIEDVRDGIDINLGVDGINQNSEVDESREAPVPGHISNSIVVRNNRITNCNYAYSKFVYPDGTVVNTLAERHPSGISVGNVLRRFTIWGYHEFWFGDWIYGTVIENNHIFDTENAYIRLRNHQGSTVVRNNYCGGNGDKEDIVFKDIQPVNWYPEVESAIIYNNYGNAYEGIYGTVSNLQSFDKLQNGNFQEGLKYWASNYGKGYANEKATIVDGAVKVDSKIGITSADFKPQNIPANSKVAVVYDHKGSENVRVELKGYGLQTVSRDKLTTFANSDVQSGFNRTINNYTLTTTEDLDLNVVIYSLDGTAAEIDNIEFVVINEEQGYYETADGRKYNLLDGSVYGGTAQNGIVSNNADDIYKYGYTNGLQNASFDDGLKFWQLTGTATSTISANGGSIAFTASATANGIISVPFKVKNSDYSSANNKCAIMLDYTTVSANGSYYKVNLYETVNGVTTEYSLTITSGVTTANTNGLSGAYSATASWNEDAIYNIEILANRNNFSSKLNQVKLARFDGSSLTYTDMSTGEIYKNNTTLKKLQSVATTSNTAVAEEFKNGDFEDGNAYWYGTSTVADGKLTPSTTVTSLSFRVNAAVGDRVAVMFDYTATKNATLTFKGSATVSKTVTKGSGTVVTDSMNHSSAYSYQITLSKNASYDNIRVVIINSDGTYTDTITGETYLSDFTPRGGTYADGFYSPAYYESYADVLSAPRNLDFSEGFRYWTNKCDRSGYASEDTVLNGDGSIKIIADDNYDGITTARFILPNAKLGRVYRVYYDALGEENINLRIWSSEGKWVGYANSYNTGGVWKTVSCDFTVTDASAVYYCDFQLHTAGTEASMKNVRIRYLDEGGKGLYANFDGAPIDYDYGDANADGRIDLADLVAMKKYAADSSSKIYVAAANIDKDANISITATDISYMQNFVLTGKKEF